MNPAQRDEFHAWMTRLALPHLGGFDVLLLGHAAARLEAFAAFQGASRCESRESPRPHGPDESGFDVVVWSQDDGGPILPGDLLGQAVALLAPRGLLVLECRPADAPAAGDPGIDSRALRLREQVEHALQPYAYKLVGASQSQSVVSAGAGAIVYHVAARRPVACLLMAPPGWGKSTVARQVFGGGKDGLPVIGADSLIHNIALGKLNVDPGLRSAIRDGFDPSCIDQAVHRIMSRGHLRAWIDTVIAASGGSDFVLDGFVPVPFHGHVEAVLRDCGYFPVRIGWDRLQPAPMDVTELASELEGFQRGAVGTAEGSAAAGPSEGATGNVDAVEMGPLGITIRGWAVTGGGHRPVQLQARDGKDVLDTLQLEVEQRPDVRHHFGLPHDRIGFRLLVRPGVRTLRRTDRVSVWVADGNGGWQGPLHRSR